MTTTPAASDLRQAAIAAALNGMYDVRWPDGEPYLHMGTEPAQKLADAAVTAALSMLSTALFIAPDGYDQPCVWADTGDDARPDLLAEKRRLDPRLWALLAAVIPAGHDHAQEDGS